MLPTAVLPTNKRTVCRNWKAVPEKAGPQRGKEAFFIILNSASLTVSYHIQFDLSTKFDFIIHAVYKLFVVNLQLFDRIDGALVWKSPFRTSEVEVAVYRLVNLTWYGTGKCMIFYRNGTRYSGIPSFWGFVVVCWYRFGLVSSLSYKCIHGTPAKW